MFVAATLGKKGNKHRLFRDRHGIAMSACAHAGIPCPRGTTPCPHRPCQRRALHLVSAPFGNPFSGPATDAVVAQLVRAPVCGTGGRWFEPTQLYHSIQPTTVVHASAMLSMTG